MTAQVSVINKLGIALAADSAVTISGGQDDAKVYSSADKLFQLANNAPVGIMIYGGAEFLGLPWETVIKSYRKQLGRTTFGKMLDYTKDFFGFMQTNADMNRYFNVKNSVASGVVFAGFGDKEYMPVLLGYEVENIVNKKLQINEIHKIEISPKHTVEIIPFAQKDIVHSFMEGIHPEFANHIHSTVNEMFKYSLGALLDEINPDASDKQKKQLMVNADKILHKLFSDWRNKNITFWRPIINMVKFLPKDELAATAEMLVNLTKFRQRISSDIETVGGPIDVAMITKGDGFVWIKRKHYFMPELNYRKISSYIIKPDVTDEN